MAAERSNRVSKYTLAGRIIVLIHVLAAIGGTLLYVLDFIPKLPQGRYLLLMFAIPVVLVCFISFRFTTCLANRLGVRVYTDKQN